MMATVLPLSGITALDWKQAYKGEKVGGSGTGLDGRPGLEPAACWLLGAVSWVRLSLPTPN